MLREDRRLKLGEKKKYDARIDYIENTGTQWIDTGFKPNLDTKIVADMQGITSTDYGRFFGCVGGTSYNSAPTFVMNYETGFTGSLHFMWGTDTSWNTNSNYSSSTATKRTIYEVDKNVLKVDGTTAFTRTYTAWQATTNLAIFSYMKTSGITTDAGEYLKGRLYGFKIYDNGTLVRDYIPVRVGTEACLYDKVTDELYHNAGTGSFTYGGDVIPILYLESTGTQYINTGIINTVSTEFDLQFKLNDSTGDRKLIGQGFKFGFAHTNNKWRIIDSNWYQTSYATGTDYHRVYTSNGNYIMDDTTIASRLSYKTAGTYPMLLFAASSQNSISPDGNCAIMQLYSCKIYEGNTLVRDYIPAVAGTTGYLYDVENDILYSNAGTGTFKLSPDSGYVEPEYVFSASNTSISHVYGGASTNVTITSTADGSSQGYYVSSKPSWVTTSISGSTLTITSSSNSNTSSRSGSVVLALNDSGNTISISVSLAAIPTEKVTVTINVPTIIRIGSNTSSTETTSYTAYIPYGLTYDVFTKHILGYNYVNGKYYTAELPERYININLEKTIYVSYYVELNGDAYDLYATTDPAVYKITLTGLYLNFSYALNTYYFGLDYEFYRYNSPEIYNGGPQFIVTVTPPYATPPYVYYTIHGYSSSIATTYTSYNSSDLLYDGAKIVYSTGLVYS